MILTTNALDHKGRQLRRGQTLPDDLPDWLVEDLKPYCVEATAHTALRLKVKTEKDFAAAWATIHSGDPETDPLLVVAADRVRLEASTAGLHRLARLRPFLDEMPAADEEPPEPERVRAEGKTTRTRRTQP